MATAMDPNEVLALLRHEAVHTMCLSYEGEKAQLTTDLHTRAEQLSEEQHTSMPLSYNEHELCDIWKEAVEEASEREAVKAEDQVNEEESSEDTLDDDDSKWARKMTMLRELNALRSNDLSINPQKKIYGPWWKPSRYITLTQLAQAGHDIPSDWITELMPSGDEPITNETDREIAEWWKDIDGYYARRSRDILEQHFDAVGLPFPGRDATKQQPDVLPTKPLQHGPPLETSNREKIWQTLLKRRNDPSVRKHLPWMGDRENLPTAPPSAADYEADWVKIGLPAPAEFGFSMQTILFAHLTKLGVVFDPANPLEYSLVPDNYPEYKAVKPGEMENFYKRCAAVMYWLHGQQWKLPTELVEEYLTKCRPPSSRYKFPAADEVAGFIHRIDTVLAGEDFFYSDLFALLPFAMDLHSHESLVRQGGGTLPQEEPSTGRQNDETKLEWV